MAEATGVVDWWPTLYARAIIAGTLPQLLSLMNQ